MINLSEKDLRAGRLSFDVRTIYIIAPMTIYKDDRQYHEVVNNFKRLNQSVRFLLPDELYADNEDFRQNHRKHTKKADAGIMLSDEGIIGYGCYTEMRCLHVGNKPVYYFHSGRLHKCFSIEILPGNSLVKYAKINEC